MKTGRSSLWRPVAFLWIPTVVALVMGGYFFATDFREMRREEEIRYLEDLERFAEGIEPFGVQDFVWKKGEGVVSGDQT